MNRKNYNRKEFERIISDAIDEAFSTLGESIKESIYFHLEKSAGIEKQEIPYRIDDFQNALEKIFGIGARHLEIQFAKKLHGKIKIKYKWNKTKWIIPDLTFQEYIRLVKTELEKPNTTTFHVILEEEIIEPRN